MKKAFTIFLVLINIIIMFGLLGLVGYQFTEIVKKNSEVEQLKTNVKDLKDKQKKISDSGSISQPNQTSTTPVSESKPTEKSVKIFFSQSPENELDFTATTGVTRTTSRGDLEIYVIEELIKGPSSSEKTLKLENQIILEGNSNCGGKDFTLTIDKKVATLKFCKLVVTNGIGTDARIKNQIEKTLKQFDTIEKIVILTSNGSCFGDLSGTDVCKK
jgi:Sporulation and spore germination